MRTKISKLSELSDISVEKDKLDTGVLNFVSLFKVGNLLKSFSALKRTGLSAACGHHKFLFIDDSPVQVLIE